jgi:hypothetical protein
VIPVKNINRKWHGMLQLTCPADSGMVAMCMLGPDGIGELRELLAMASRLIERFVGGLMLSAMGAVRIASRVASKYRDQAAAGSSGEPPDPEYLCKRIIRRSR